MKSSLHTYDDRVKSSSLVKNALRANILAEADTRHNYDPQELPQSVQKSSPPRPFFPNPRAPLDKQRAAPQEGHFLPAKLIPKLVLGNMCQRRDVPMADAFDDGGGLGMMVAVRRECGGCRLHRPLRGPSRCNLRQVRVVRTIELISYFCAPALTMDSSIESDGYGEMIRRFKLRVRVLRNRNVEADSHKMRRV
ncbi:hypothetical protein Slin14017_G099980 [Septoria linicola]|nr:hypothetical protein Slin14017_G099980 [Septoria linicola]